MKYRVALVLLAVGLPASRASAQVSAGGEFQVNSYTTSLQLGPCAAWDAAGNLLVTWSSMAQDGNGYGVFAQRYDVSGVPRGAEFRVNTYTTGNQAGAPIAADATGGFVTFWQSYGQDGDGWGVLGQRYDAGGAPRGSEFQVNSYTTGHQSVGPVAADRAGNFVVTWFSYDQDGSGPGVFAQRYDASVARRGSEFRVNTYTTGFQLTPSVASDAAGNFVVAWWGAGNGDVSGIFAQRYDTSGATRGAEFQVNTNVSFEQYWPSVASDLAGNFVVIWTDLYNGVAGQRYEASGAPRGAEFSISGPGGMEPSVAADATGDFVVAWQAWGQDGSLGTVVAQRYDASGNLRGAEFQVNTYTTDSQRAPSVASDTVGNFVVTWHSYGQDGSSYGVYAQRFGGIVPAAHAVDATASAGSDGNGVFEPGETTVALAPSWRNVNGAAQTFDGVGLSFSGPPASGVSYALTDAAGSYGGVANGATAACSDCYQVGVAFGGTRPSTHWDATFTERLTPDALGQTKPWSLHIGESFTDVPKTSGYYRFVETLLHKKVTAGCSATAYCPTSAVTREQMSVLVLVGKEGAGYLPAGCTTPLFGDVPASSLFCRFIEELSRRGVTSGCGGGNYCPTNPVTREQMSVFLLHTLDPALNPPACTTPVFPDVPASSPFCRWVEELARRGITTGCGGGNYCPTDAVTREQMAVFISATFGLTLYGP